MEKAHEKSYSLTPLQQGMVYHSLLAPQSGVFVQQLVGHLHEKLNISAFKEAWQRVIARQPVLRTRFCLTSMDGFYQEVDTDAVPEWTEVNWSHLSSDDRERKWQRYLRDDRRRGFDFSQSPLMRLALFRLADDYHFFLWTYYHALLDGRSQFHVIKEFFGFYEALCLSEEYQTTDSPPFQDFVRWLNLQDFSRARDFWQERLRGFETPNQLVEASAASYTGLSGNERAVQEIHLTEEASDRLHSFVAKNDITVGTVLQGAWAALLSRYSGDEDVVFGMTRACRHSSMQGAESMVGLLTNTVPVRVRMTPDLPVLPWLKMIRSQWIAMRPYEHTPLTDIQSWSGFGPSKSLFESMLIFESYSLNELLRAQGEKWNRREFQLHENGSYPLVALAYGGSSLLMRIGYDRSRFDDAAVKRMLGHWQTLLLGLIMHPSQRLENLPMLSDAERQMLLTEWNSTKREYPKHMCLHQLVEAQAAKTPDKVAVLFEDERFTYDQVNTRANQLACHLQSVGVRREVLVAVCLNRTPALVIGILAILKAGGAYVPLDPNYPKERLSSMLADSGASVLLTQVELLESLPEHNLRMVCLEIDSEAIARKSHINPRSGVSPENLAYAIYTSGSTGRPKLIGVEHRSAVNAVFHTTHAVLCPEELAMVPFIHSISFDPSVCWIFSPLSSGGSIIVLESIFALPRCCHADAVTLLACAPSVLRSLLRDFVLPESLGVICVGAEVASDDLFTQLAEYPQLNKVINFYGPTETTIYCSHAVLSERRKDSSETDRTSEISCAKMAKIVGKPIWNIQFYILDARLRPVPVCVPGELHIGGDGLARGYLNRPELTAERFIANPFSDMPGSRLYKTGDLAKYLPDGNIEVLGRLDFQVKVRGFRIELGDIEATLEQHPAVRQAAVTAREDIPGNKQLVAYIVANDHQAIPVNTLRNFLKKKLPSYMVPSMFEMINTLPLTPNGKIDRRALPTPDRSGSQPVEALVAPRDELEMQLTKTCERVLGVQPIGTGDNFFELGGHSLLAVRLIRQIEKIFGKDLPIATLFQAPTIEQLANILREQGWSASLSSLEAIEIGAAGSKGMMRMKRKIVDHIPRKSHAHLKQQYHKIKKHPGYLYLKRQYFKSKSSLTKRFLSYSPAQLEKKLREIGLSEADTVYMHSAFRAFNGFEGGPQQIIDCILKVIGSSGNLLMVSMPYTGATAVHLKAVKTFDVIKTESSMGIITEIFRRKKDVVRSLNPAHPILAFGPDAKWIVSDHDKTMYSCGKDSPFEKLLELDAKAFFFDVPFRTMTFFHYLEDRFKDCSPVKLYDDEPLESTVIDSKGNEFRVKTYVFSQEAREKRSGGLIERELKMKNLIKTDRIGNTKHILVNLKNVVGCAQELVNSGMHFYNA